MKKVLISFVLAAFFVGIIEACDRYVRVARESLPKTVHISVPCAISETFISIKNDKIVVESTKTTILISGSGVFISDVGHILTCAHLFTLGIPSTATVIGSDGWEYPAEIIKLDVDHDLALIKVEGYGLEYAKLAQRGSLEVGQDVMAIGSPLGLPFSVSHGIISSLDRQEEGRSLIQSDVFINPGNSGGPLFNMKGELIGINSFIIPPIHAPVFTGCGFSVSISDIRMFLRTIKDLPKEILWEKR